MKKKGLKIKTKKLKPHNNLLLKQITEVQQSYSKTDLLSAKAPVFTRLNVRDQQFCPHIFTRNLI